MLCINQYKIPVIEEEEHRQDFNSAQNKADEESPVLEFSKSKITTDSTDDFSPPEKRKTNFNHTNRWSPDNSPNPFNAIRANMVKFSLEKATEQISPGKIEVDQK